MSFAVVPLTQTVPVSVCKEQAIGSAMQAVAQSAAIAVQDGTDMMRAMEQIAVAGAAVLTAKFAKDEDPTHLANAATLISDISTASSSAFATISKNAASAMADFGLSAK